MDSSMESLQLPQELYWDGKMEPNSPSSETFSLPNSEESWVFEDNFAKDILFIHDIDENILLDNKTIIEHLGFKEYKEHQVEQTTEIEGELLYEFDVKDEQWLDGKPDLQHFIDFTQNATQPPPAAAQLVKVQNDYDIIMELGNMYNNVELTQLTPPQTPPQSQDCIGTNNEMLDVVPQPQLTNFNQYDMMKDDSGIAMSPTNSMLDYSSEVSYCSVPPTIARDMQIVDEILANRIKDLPDFSNEDTMFSMTSSSLSQSNDEDWLPSPSSSVASPSTSKIIDGGITKRRVRPHGRCVEDKKSRKKEQNKNAATRYRQKKKQEMDEILEEERLLTVRNEELKKNVSEVRSEVKYLKQLARELYRSRGLIH